LVAKPLEHRLRGLGRKRRKKEGREREEGKTESSLSWRDMKKKRYEEKVVRAGWGENRGARSQNRVSGPVRWIS